jgi:ClpP class serine protease
MSPGGLGDLAVDPLMEQKPSSSRVAIALIAGLTLLSFIFALALGGGSAGRGGKKDGPRIGQLREDDSIKAIVVRINSPGGAVGPSQELYREVVKTRQKKKVVASFGSVSASGGYYIGAAADQIFASPGTLTGSIGVITTMASFS